jgi:hypothetical protein
MALHSVHHHGVSIKVHQQTKSTRLTNAWRSPAQRSTMDSGGPKSHGSTLPDDDPMRRRTAAYNEMVRRICDAWKTQPRDPDDDLDADDPSEPANAVEQQLERWQGRDPDDLARAVEARRRATHAEFSQRVSNAWRAK